MSQQLVDVLEKSIDKADSDSETELDESGLVEGMSTVSGDGSD